MINRLFLLFFNHSITTLLIFFYWSDFTRETKSIELNFIQYNYEKIEKRKKIVASLEIEIEEWN